MFSARLITVSLALVAVALIPVDDARAAQTAGVQAHLLWADVDQTRMEQRLDEARAAGAGLIRVDVGWSALEEAKGEWSAWHLRRLDAVVDAAEARGLDLLLTFWLTPCWALTQPLDPLVPCDPQTEETHLQPPADARDYADALSHLAARYRGRVRAWEIWNEPNSSSYFVADDPVGEYTRLARTAYPAVKAADPDTTVVVGALSGSDAVFADALYARGIGGYLDALSIHPYSEDRSPLDPQTAYPNVSFNHGVPAVRQVMISHGDTSPMWLTEFGWSTCTVRGDAPWRNCVDETTQAQYLDEAFTHMRVWDYVEAGVWYALNDRSADTAERNDSYGLLRFGGEPKPAYAAFAAQPPDTEVLGGTDILTSGAAAELTLRATDPTATFECRLDEGEWSLCASPYRTGPLTAGTHMVEVRAVDAAGHADPMPAARSIEVMPADDPDPPADEPDPWLPTTTNVVVAPEPFAPPLGTSLTDLSGGSSPLARFVGPRRIERLLRRGLGVELTCGRPCRWRLTLWLRGPSSRVRRLGASHTPVVIGRVGVVLPDGGTRRAYVRPAPRHRDLLRGARRLGLSLRAEATDARTGATTVIERRLVLARR